MRTWCDALSTLWSPLLQIWQAHVLHPRLLGCWSDIGAVGLVIKLEVALGNEAENVWLRLLEGTNPFAVYLLVEAREKLTLPNTAEMSLLKWIEITDNSVHSEIASCFELLQVLVVEYNRGWERLR